MLYYFEGTAALSVELDHVVMVVCKRDALTHCDECDALLLEVFVNVSFCLDADRTRALIQDCVLRAVVQQTSQGDSLLLPSAERVIPFFFFVHASSLICEVWQVDSRKQVNQVLVIIAFLQHFSLGIRVNNLVTQCSNRQVGSLRHIEQLVHGWLVNLAPEQWPQLTKDPEQRALSAAVGALYEHMHARLYFEVQLTDQDVSVWSNHRNSVETN
mmetsp:Transcript_8929/g.17256  ORF Transcript_8929/g.17256 Transcript_8929/m.17256 type:complete len:214 (+) Transcript_8929:3545-4186(+)